MAYWDYKTRTTYFRPAEELGNGWYRVDCGCSGGIQWGGPEPRECPRCNGTGCFYWHQQSKVFAKYPGGPFFGKGELSDLERYGGKDWKPVKPTS